jgi:hypothetical protein
MEALSASSDIVSRRIQHDEAAQVLVSFDEWLQEFSLAAMQVDNPTARGYQRLPCFEHRPAERMILRRAHL